MDTLLFSESLENDCEVRVYKTDPIHAHRGEYKIIGFDCDAEKPYLILLIKDLEVLRSSLKKHKINFNI